MKKLAVDFEFASRTWWDEGGRDLWEAIAGESEAKSAIVDDDVARSWLTQAQSLPGWDDGHEFAPHPIALRDVEEEDLM